MSDKKAICIAITLIIIAIGTVGLGIYCAYEYSQRNVYPDADYTCGTFGNLTNHTLTMTKDVWAIWRWKYESNDNQGHFIQRCPSLTHDASLYHGGRLVARTDGKIFTLLAKYYIKDCHGDDKYYVEAGSLFQAIINTNKIWVSMVVYFPNETVHSYIDSAILVTGSVELKNPSGKKIAYIDKHINRLRWQWVYNIFDRNYIDMDTLVAITSKLSFIPSFADKMFDVANNKKDNGDKTDICNNLLWYGGWTTLAFVIAFVIGIGWYGVHKYQHRNDEKNDLIINKDDLYDVYTPQY
jgi:hypothetical protein